MKLRFLVMLVLGLGCLSVAVGCWHTRSNAPARAVAHSTTLFDGTKPHAVDIDGKAIADASTNQPDKPIILSKDSQDLKYGELKAEAAFDHAKHNTEVTHSLDGKTLTTCVYCHHTEQPMPVAGKPYLNKSERNKELTAAQLDSSKQAVNSCRHCHFQEDAPSTDEFPPKSVRYPKEMGLEPTGKLTNENAYHSRCKACHEAAMKRDEKLKAPIGCEECHVRIKKT